MTAVDHTIEIVPGPNGAHIHFETARRDGEEWAAIAEAAEAEPEKALRAFEQRVLRLLANKPRDLSYRVQQALGQYEKRIGAAELALAQANRHRPAGGWRPIEPAE